MELLLVGSKMRHSTLMRIIVDLAATRSRRLKIVLRGFSCATFIMSLIATVFFLHFFTSRRLENRITFSGGNCTFNNKILSLKVFFSGLSGNNSRVVEIEACSQQFVVTSRGLNRICLLRPLKTPHAAYEDQNFLFLLS